MIGGGGPNSLSVAEGYVTATGTERTEYRRGLGSEKPPGFAGGTVEGVMGNGLGMNVHEQMSDNQWDSLFSTSTSWIFEIDTDAGGVNYRRSRGLPDGEAPRVRRRRCIELRRCDAPSAYIDTSIFT